MVCPAASGQSETQWSVIAATGDTAIRLATSTSHVIISTLELGTRPGWTFASLVDKRHTEFERIGLSIFGRLNGSDSTQAATACGTMGQCRIIAMRECTVILGLAIARAKLES